MKILVLADSHRYLTMMKRFVKATQPDAIVHLGDFVDDGREIAQMFPDIPFYQVPGNCDEYLGDSMGKSERIQVFGGVRVMMTHGHRYGVKTALESLCASAREKEVQAVFFGHTHQALCLQAWDGLWILNPGTCGWYGGTVGWVEIENKQILSCRILREQDLEVIK